MGKDPGSVPLDTLAWFLTWTTYGSWLPGDASGLGGETGPLPRARRTAR